MSLPTKTSLYNYGSSADAIIIGSFTGTLVIYLLWSSVILQLSLFLSKLQVSIISVVAQFIIFLFGAVSMLLVNTSVDIRKKEDILLNGVALISNIDENTNSFDYQWGGINLKGMDKPITTKTKFRVYR